MCKLRMLVLVFFYLVLFCHPFLYEYSRIPRHCRPMKRSSSVATLILLVVLATSAFAYWFWIRDADHRDFYPRWAGARRALLGYGDICSEEATRDMQMTLYGELIPPGQDQQGFAYPATLIPLLLPFALIENVEIATAIWVGVTVGLMLTGLLLLQSRDNEFSVLRTVFFILWFFSLLMIFQGQITGILIAAFAVGFWSMDTKYALLGGLVCSLTWVKPELALLPICTLTILSFSRRRYQFALGILLGSLASIFLSVAFVGFWFLDWIEGLLRYSQYAKVVWPIAMLFDFSPFLGILAFLLIILAVYSVRRSADYLFSMSIASSYLLLPQTPIWGLSLLLVPMSILWTRLTRIPIIIVWLAGWVSILGNLASPDWWVVQVILFPILIVAVVFFSKGANTLTNTEVTP